MSDLIKHPTHYTSHPSGVECITIIQHFRFNIGTAMKHLWRAGLKEGSTTETDLRKALEYIGFELELVRGKRLPGVASPYPPGVNVTGMTGRPSELLPGNSEVLGD